jgi:hypothetical protein
LVKLTREQVGYLKEEREYEENRAARERNNHACDSITGAVSVLQRDDPIWLVGRAEWIGGSAFELTLKSLLDRELRRRVEILQAAARFLCATTLSVDERAFASVRFCQLCDAMRDSVLEEQNPEMEMFDWSARDLPQGVEGVSVWMLSDDGQ